MVTLTEEMLTTIIDSLPFYPREIILGTKQYQELCDLYYPGGKIVGNEIARDSFKIESFSYKGGLISIVESASTNFMVFKGDK